MEHTAIHLIYVVVFNELLLSLQAEFVSALKPTSRRPVTSGRTMVPLPRVMKVKLVPQFATESVRLPPVFLHGGTTDFSDEEPTEGITRGPVRVFGTNKSSSPAMNGALKTLLSKEIDRDHPCGRVDADGTKVGVITCPRCGKKIEINLDLNENLPTADASDSKTTSSREPNDSTEFDSLDYHGY